MEILNDPASFSRWRAVSGMKPEVGIGEGETYGSVKKYTKQLKEQTGESLRKLIVEDINSQKGVRIINERGVDTIIDSLSSANDKAIKLFKEYLAEDYFRAFRFLHKLTYGTTPSGKPLLKKQK